jgi:hypothetical protein
LPPLILRGGIIPPPPVTEALAHIKIPSACVILLANLHTLKEAEMAESKEEIAAKQAEIAARQNEIKSDIKNRIIEIITLSESLTSLMAIEKFREDDLDKAFEVNDAIQEQFEEINALLFDLRDNLFDIPKT